MKKKYVSPVAEKLEFDYTQVVVASIVHGPGAGATIKCMTFEDYDTEKTCKRIQ